MTLVSTQQAWASVSLGGARRAGGSLFLVFLSLCCHPPPRSLMDGMD